MSIPATRCPWRAPSVEDAVADLLDALGVNHAAEGIQDTHAGSRACTASS